MGDDDTEFGDFNLDDMSLEFDESGDSEDSKEELDLSLDDLDLDGGADDNADDTLTDLDLELDEAEKSLAESAESGVEAGAAKDDLADLDLDEPAEPEAPAADKADSLEDLLGDDDLEIEEQGESLSLEEEPAREDAPVAEPEIPAVPVPQADELASSAPQESADVLGDEDDFDFLGETDENATKLDLAKAYIDMGDTEGARDILNEVISEGNDQQQAEARELMSQVG